jgi:hypothetical protein
MLWTRPVSNMSGPDESPGKLNVLVAYPYVKGAILGKLREFGGAVRFLLDSGAFTAWKAGKPIQLDDYCRFLESLPVQPWRYFTLDVIGDPQASMHNYETMLKRGFKPVPIFTRGEDPSVLEDYYKTSDVVGIGGLVGTPNNKAFVNGIMRRVGDRRVHWLGFTSIDFVKHYRPYMCDSSTWEAGARFAAVKLYMGGSRSVTVKKSDFQGRPNPQVAARLQHFGIDPYKMGRDAAWAGGVSMNRTLCAASGVALSLDVERNLGTKMFLALTTEMALSLVCGQYIRQVERKAA